MNTLALARSRPAARGCPTPTPLDELLIASLGRAEVALFPFRHLRLEHLLPGSVAAALQVLAAPPPAATPVLGEPRGSVAAARRLRPAAVVSRSLARAFAADEVADAIARRADVDVAGRRVLVTVRQEVDGYACEPVTGEGEARFRFVVGLSPMRQNDLGPDLYLSPQAWAMQLPWRAGSAFAFAPGPDTWHGFEPRMIRHLRASLVVDYL